MFQPHPPKENRNKPKLTFRRHVLEVSADSRAESGALWSSDTGPCAEKDPAWFSALLSPLWNSLQFLFSRFLFHKLQSCSCPLQDTHGGPAKITLKNEACHNWESTPTLSSLKTGVPHLLESDDKNPKEEPMGHCCFLFKCLSEP